MIKNYFEKKKMNLKAISDALGYNYSTFRDRVDKDALEIVDLKTLYKKGIFNWEDIEFVLEK